MSSKIPVFLGVFVASCENGFYISRPFATLTRATRNTEVKQIHKAEFMIFSASSACSAVNTFGDQDQSRVNTLICTKGCNRELTACKDGSIS
ncbi:MAG: hypothetical protein PWP34_2538 [Desulfuromonadales bacterium]|jgi:hypothetical protein|nr:hypothetical protein [Desulfuromonadales bacterium]